MARKTSFLLVRYSVFYLINHIYSDDYIAIPFLSQLQASMDAYTEAISTQTTPLAPLYPLEWLRRREMEEVRWFQASTENANPLLTHVAEGVWWRKAVRGLSLWKNLRKNTLISSNLKK